MININNRADIFTKLTTLSAETPAIFGKMTAQHMVEHLIFTVQFSNGALPQKLYFPQDKANKMKAFVIYSEKALPVGFKAPMLGDELPQLRFPNLKAAINGLKTELDQFDKYFAEHKEAKPTSPTMGPLDHQEWILFHNKHFRHHFRQFKLI